VVRDRAAAGAYSTRHPSRKESPPTPKAAVMKKVLPRLPTCRLHAAT
jgi:hypothetical protein